LAMFGVPRAAGRRQSAPPTLGGPVLRGGQPTAAPWKARGNRCCCGYDWCRQTLVADGVKWPTNEDKRRQWAASLALSSSASEKLAGPGDKRLHRSHWPADRLGSTGLYKKMVGPPDRPFGEIKSEIAAAEARFGAAADATGQLLAILEQFRGQLSAEQQAGIDLGVAILRGKKREEAELDTLRDQAVHSQAREDKAKDAAERAAADKAKLLEKISRLEHTADPPFSFRRFMDGEVLQRDMEQWVHFTTYSAACKPAATCSIIMRSMPMRLPLRELYVTVCMQSLNSG